MRWGNPLAFRDREKQEAMYPAAGQELRRFFVGDGWGVGKRTRTLMLG
jgi:hypothetical protein